MSASDFVTPLSQAHRKVQANDAVIGVQHRRPVELDDTGVKGSTEYRRSLKEA